ncbi:MAG: lactate utilization protein [Oscillospiraceae bacterium]|nr:lactate utilization protein [Oscillospiraceae bacterium]
MADLKKVLAALEANCMTGEIVESRDEVVAAVAKLLHEGDVIASGGSMTLKECGVIEYVKSGPYKYLDRATPGLTREQMEYQVFRGAFTSDVYLMSSNAITEHGELYNVDGNSNRVAALLYGPKKVIIVAGQNKIVPNLAEAAVRVKTKAAPPNCVRLDCKTYCNETGACVSLKDEDAFLCDGCKSDDRICCNYVVSAKQRQKGRIHVILVKEDLGF